jgi:hypothetical protein
MVTFLFDRRFTVSKINGYLEIVSPLSKSEEVIVYDSISENFQSSPGIWNKLVGDGAISGECHVHGHREWDDVRKGNKERKSCTYDDQEE